MDDHQHTDFSVKPTLTGELVVLRPFDLAQDAPAIRDWLTDPEGPGPLARASRHCGGSVSPCRRGMGCP
ncbi:hypothetical protein GCM10020367_59350 [Streptomyces sannanensis]|uniref:Uncharacterized protein n=1 Tax=Streptomyces sannanensis TaxID=285536 RepID=A0ABP6SKI7_9ACTN